MVYFLKIFISIFFFWVISIPCFAADIKNKVIKSDTITSKIKKFECQSLLESIRFEDNITFCHIKIPVNQPDIRQRLEKEMLLALWNRPQIILWIKRASKYFVHIERILNQEKLPLDLKYVAVVESALRPHVRSSKSAVGFWQFIKSTGKNYGLTINSDIDERRNLFKSTEAACKYIKKLKKQFGSYLLALAAYNMGESGLESEIKAQGTKDFFSLYLPLQTQRYIFKIVATQLIMENPEKYGFLFKKDDLYPVFSFDRVNISSKKAFPIYLVSKSANVSFKAVKDMNPEVRGYFLSKGKHSLLIPKGRAKYFKANFANIYSQWLKENQHEYHVVRKGETLLKIARKYKISLSNLLKWNNISKNHVIHPGNRLIIGLD